MDNNRCNDCRWWLRVEGYVDAHGRELGDCRRHAPTVTQTADLRKHATFPRMSELQFCGDFAPRHVPPMEVADA